LRRERGHHSHKNKDDAAHDKPFSPRAGVPVKPQAKVPRAMPVNLKVPGPLHSAADWREGFNEIKGDIQLLSTKFNDYRSGLKQLHRLANADALAKDAK